MKAKLLLTLALAAWLGLAAAEELPSFQELDQDGRGIVTRDEAREYPMVAERFDEIDQNNDGLIDRAEYARWLATQGS